MLQKLQQLMRDLLGDTSGLLLSLIDLSKLGNSSTASIHWALAAGLPEDSEAPKPWPEQK